MADDHQNILNSIAKFLNNLPNIEVVATAENGEKAVALARSFDPDVLILDIDMPKLNGLQVSARLRSLGINAKILIFSIYDEPSIVRAAFNQGASGYVLKNRAAVDLVKAVEKLSAGEQFASAPIANYLPGSQL